MWYRNSSAEIVLVDPARKTKAVADAGTLADLGIAAAAAPEQALGVPVGSAGAPLTLSPCGNLGAFVKHWNLWVRGIEYKPMQTRAAFSLCVHWPCSVNSPLDPAGAGCRDGVGPAADL